MSLLCLLAEQWSEASDTGLWPQCRHWQDSVRVGGWPESPPSAASAVATSTSTLLAVTATGSDSDTPTVAAAASRRAGRKKVEKISLGTEESPMASGGKGDALSRPSEKAKSVMDRLKSVYNVRC